MAGDASRQVGTSLEADVDGDGASDRIALVADPTADPECATFVVADVGGVVAAAPVWEVGPEGGLPQPRVHGVSDIDGRPGNEILVEEAAGASTQFVGAFVFVDGDLERVTVSGGMPASFEGLFPYGGSVGHLEAVDCVDDQIVISVATPSSEQGEMARGIYEVQRRFFTFDGAELETVDNERVDVRLENLDRIPEFGNSPFGSCG